MTVSKVYNYIYLWVLTKTRNKQKQPETRNYPQFQNWGNLLFSTNFFVFQTLSPNHQMRAFCVKKKQFSNLNDISHLPYFKGPHFKSDISFRVFWKSEYFGPKSINFLILTKFCLYAISKVLISNLTFTFYGSQQLSTQVIRTNSLSPFCNLFGKRYFFFVFLQNSQDIMTSIVIFFEGV